jgi:hypothetical protein
MEKQNRGKVISYPKSPDAKQRVLRFLDRALELKAVKRIELDPRSVFVERAVDETTGEDVLPAGLEGILTGEELFPGVDFILGRAELFDCTLQVPENPMLGVNAAYEDLRKRNLQPCAVLAPIGDYFDAYFGLPEGAEVGRFLGLEVIRDSLIEPGKLIFLGSVTGAAIDATHGAVLDTGVMA